MPLSEVTHTAVYHARICMLSFTNGSISCQMFQVLHAAVYHARIVCSLLKSALNEACHPFRDYGHMTACLGYSFATSLVNAVYLSTSRDISEVQVSCSPAFLSAPNVSAK